MWLGIFARRKLELLELRLDRIEREWRETDLEVTNALDKMAGIAKRFTGRKGGRPTNEEVESREQEKLLADFNRHAD